MKVFSNPYYDPFKQRNIESLIEKGELKEAVSLIDSLPQGFNYEEKLQRLKAVAEGYKAIVDKYSKLNSGEIQELKKELEAYGIAGLTEEEIKSGKRNNPEELEASLLEFNEFKKLGGTYQEYIDEEKKQSELIAQYEELGSYEEISDKLRELELLQRNIGDL